MMVLFWTAVLVFFTYRYVTVPPSAKRRELGVALTTMALLTVTLVKIFFTPEWGPSGVIGATGMCIAWIIGLVGLYLAITGSKKG